MLRKRLLRCVLNLGNQTNGAFLVLFAFVFRRHVIDLEQLPVTQILLDDYARLPVDPRFARMVLEADRNGCVRDVLVIAAALSIQDPRERPEEQRAQADQLHARFKHESSDFLTWLNLWRHVKEQQRELSSSAFRRMCRG